MDPLRECPSGQWIQSYIGGIVIRILSSEKYAVSLLFASVGGFLEAYTYVTRDGVFANAQTGNIARLGISLAQGNFYMVLRYFIPVLTFVVGVSLSIQIKEYAKKKSGLLAHWEEIILLFEMLLLLLVGFIPPDRMSILSTALISFVCSVQVQSFRKFGSNSFASTMCTGNLRNATVLLNQYFQEKDKSQLHTSLKYYGIDIVFAFGVVIGYWTTRHFACRAVWWSLLVLGVILIYVMAEGRRKME